jgi:uncharacterized membrane protein
MAQLTYVAGRVVCHQRPQRSFHLAGAPLPVCARCTGIYGGAAILAITLLMAGGRDGHTRAFSTRALRVAGAAALLPTAATLVYEWTTGSMPSHASRAAAGVPIGVFVAWTVMRQTRPEQHSE